jgi:hypothetical protein
MANVNKRPFVKFFHQDWCSDNDVDNMTMQEVGTYFTLLVRQMVEGHVKSDLSSHLKRLNVASIHEAMMLVTPRVAKKFHTDSCNSEACSGWTCGIPSDDASKLYNRKLRDVIRDQDDRSWQNRNNITSRYNGGMPTKSLESSRGSGSGPKEESPALEFDFTELLRTMPKRKVKGSYEGWEQGKAMLKYVTTQEEFNDLLAATKAYAKTRKGEDPAYHISLSNWVTKEHHRFVPAQVGASTPVETPAAAPEKAAMVESPISHIYPTNFMCPPNPVRHLGPGKRPPWMVDSLDFDAVKLAKQLFPDDASKRRWWMTSDDNEQNKGA